jgi:hypothetical protein
MARRRKQSVRGQFILSGAFVLLGVGSIVLFVVSGSVVGLALGVFWLLSGVLWFAVALGGRRREQRGYDPVLPPPAPEVVMLADQGQAIRAIKLYRTLNPGISLKEAKYAVDRLPGRN